MSEQKYYPPQILALATEALRVAKTSNCTLFAIPDPDSEWGFVPESFLGSADWMFCVDGIQRSGISERAFGLVREMLKRELVSDVDLKLSCRKFMADETERVVMAEIIRVLFAQVPELDDLVDAKIQRLNFDDFQPEKADF